MLRPAKLVLLKVTPFAKVGALRKVTSWNLEVPATYNCTLSTPGFSPKLNVLEFPIPSLSTFTSKISAEELTKPNFFHSLLTYA